VAGHKLKDQIRNTVIRNKLNIFNLKNIIQNNELKWIHNFERMEPERIPKRLMDYTPGGTRSVGSPFTLEGSAHLIETRNGSKDPKLDVVNLICIILSTQVTDFHLHVNKSW
jgi:hypothetical protein